LGTLARRAEVVTDLVRGAGFLLQGFRLLRRTGLRRYVIAPLGVNFLVFTGLIWLAAGFFSDLVHWLLPAGDAWWIGIITAMLWIFFAGIVATVLAFGFTLVANLIAAPLNGWLAQKVEHTVAPHVQGPARETGFLSGLYSTVKSEVRHLIYYLMIVGPLMLLSLVPGLVVVTAPLAFVVGGWMLALEYLAYPLENHNMSFHQLRAWVRGRRMLVAGFGIAVMVATLIPLVNFLVMPAAVAGATALFVAQQERR
jgi:CysZ protein